MNAPHAHFWLPLLTALGLVLAALTGGAVAALVAAPFTLALIGLGLRLRAGADAELARSLLVVAAVACPVAVGLACFGSAAAGLAAALLAAASAREGYRLSVATRPEALARPVAAANPEAATATAAEGTARRDAAAVERPDRAGPLAGAWDEAALWAVQALMPRSGQAEPALLAQRLRAAAERQRELGWIADPSRAHPRPPALEKPRLAPQRLRGVARELRLAECLRVDSEYEPQDPDCVERWRSFTANRVAVARLWRHAGEPRPTLLCVPPLGFGRLGIRGSVARTARRFDLRGLYADLGLDLAVIVPPLHGERAAGSGVTRALRADPQLATAALAQLVWDLRRLAGWLRASGAPAVGVLGLGVGGTAAALLASLDARLACTALVSPAVTLAATFWRGLPAGRRLAWEAAGIDDELLAELFAPFEPLRHAPRSPAAGRFLAGGCSDRVTPPRALEALWRHWGEPAIHWQPGSHFAPRAAGAQRASLAAHLRRSLVDLPAPTRLPLSRFRR